MYPWDWLLRWLYRLIQFAVLALFVVSVLGLIGAAPVHDFLPHATPFP